MGTKFIVEGSGKQKHSANEISTIKTLKDAFRKKMNPPELTDDWETLKKEDLDGVRRQMSMFIASITDAAKQGTKAQLSAVLQPWQDAQDVVLGLNELITE